MIEKLLLLFALLCSGSGAFAATYAYQGTNYGTVSGSVYTTAMKVTGSFTTAVALPPNLSSPDIGPAGMNLVTSWNFNDGVNTYSTATSNIHTFGVITDGTGKIAQFSIVLLTPKGPNTLNELLDELLIATPATLAYAGVPCQGLDSAGSCNSGSPVAGTSQASTTQPSQFSLVNTQDTVGAPIGSPPLLSVLALLLTLAAGGLLRLDARPRD